MLRWASPPAIYFAPQMDTYFIFPSFCWVLPSINSAWVISAGSLDLGTERVKTGNENTPHYQNVLQCYNTSGGMTNWWIKMIDHSGVLEKPERCLMLTHQVERFTLERRNMCSCLWFQINFKAMSYKSISPHDVFHTFIKWLTLKIWWLVNKDNFISSDILQNLPCDGDATYWVLS